MSELYYCGDELVKNYYIFVPDMKPLTFTISSPATFRDMESDQLITFYNETNGLRFHWQGAGMAKSGDCQIVHEQGSIYLDLYANNTRESRFLVTILDIENDNVTGFTLKDRPGNVMEFRKS